MTSLAVTIPLALVMGLCSLGVFFWALKSDQFVDLEGASNRILIDEEEDLPELEEHR